MKNFSSSDLIRILFFWTIGHFFGFHAESQADVGSTTGLINFDANMDGQSEARLTSVGLAIGPNLSPSTNLLVQGNAMFSNSLSVGSTSGSSNLNISGTIGFSVKNLSANDTLGDDSIVLVDTSSANILLTLPYAGNMSGRNFKIKKLSSFNKLSIYGGSNLIDSTSVLELTTSGNNYPYVSLASDGRQWYICEGSSGMASTWAWTPAQITTQAWYDASDTSTLSLNALSGLVNQWNDKSGSSLNLSQANIILQPATGGVINGLNAVNFTNSTMSTSINPFGATINNAFVICVHKSDVVSPGTNPTLFSLSGTDLNRWQAHAPYINGQAIFDCGNAVENHRVQASYNNSAGNVMLVSFYCSTTENIQEIFKNGSFLNKDTRGAAVTTTGNIFLGSSGSSYTYQDTTIGEFIVINGTVSQPTREKIEGYLAWKWGINSSLPASHPYKVAPISY